MLMYGTVWYAQYLCCQHSSLNQNAVLHMAISASSGLVLVSSRMAMEWYAALPVLQPLETDQRVPTT